MGREVVLEFILRRCGYNVLANSFILNRVLKEKKVFATSFQSRECLV